MLHIFKVLAAGNVKQPIQWSNEYYDDELDLVYFNYRHYSSTEGRWNSRDLLNEMSTINLYRMPNSLTGFDYLGLVFGVYYMREATFTGHAWIQLDGTASKRFELPQDYLKQHLPNVSYLEFIMPKAIGFYPARETDQRTWLETAAMILIPIYFLGGKTKREYEEKEKYEHLFFIEDTNGQPTLMFNAGQYDTDLISNEGMYLEYGDNLDKFGNKVCCQKLARDSRRDKNRVLSCILNHPSGNYYFLYLNNCRDVAKEILEDCCLAVQKNQMTNSKGTPITTLRVNWRWRKTGQ